MDRPPVPRELLGARGDLDRALRNLRDAVLVELEPLLERIAGVLGRIARLLVKAGA